MSELKPCPFCNGEDVNLGYYIDDSSVHCATCRKLVILPISRNNTTEAIEQWNHRPFESHAVEVLAEKLYKLDIIGDPFYYSWENARADHKEQHRAEARELLGIKENNDKEI